MMRRCRPLIPFPPIVNSFEGKDRENKHGGDGGVTKGNKYQT